MQQHYQLSPVPPLTRVTKALIVVNVVVYLLDLALNRMQVVDLSWVFGLVPIRVLDQGWVWQLVTYMFIHGRPEHILLNMLILWYFGAEIELRLGVRGFLFYFFLCGIGAGLFDLGITVLVNDPVRYERLTIGASGAIFGILAAYAILYGNRYFLVFFVFPMKAKYFVLVIAALELLLGIEKRPNDNVAHFTHVGGALVGALYIYLRYVVGAKAFSFRQHRRDAEKEKLKKKFTLIVNDSGSEDPDPPQNDHKPQGPYWN